MSVHYIIDGYNLVKQIPHLTSKKLKSAREGLIYLIKKYKLTGSPKNEVTIVFDGQEDVIAPRETKDFEIIFTKGESADDKIKKIVKTSSNPTRLIVVTDDKEVIFFTKNHRALSYSVSKFLAKILKGKDKRETSKEKSDLPTTLANEITKELKKIWLKDNEGK